MNDDTRLTDVFAHVGITPEWTYKNPRIIGYLWFREPSGWGQGVWFLSSQHEKSSLIHLFNPHHFPITVRIKSRSLLVVCKVLSHRTLPPLPLLPSFPLGLVFFHFLKRHSSSHLMAFTDAVPLPGTLLSALTALIPSDP